MLNFSWHLLGRGANPWDHSDPVYPVVEYGWLQFNTMRKSQTVSKLVMLKQQRQIITTKIQDIIQNNPKFQDNLKYQDKFRTIMKFQEFQEFQDSWEPCNDYQRYRWGIPNQTLICIQACISILSIY